MSQILNLLKPIQSGIEYVIVFLYNNVVANYGVVIILLTIIVRLDSHAANDHADPVHGENAKTAAADSGTPKKI